MLDCVEGCLTPIDTGCPRGWWGVPSMPGPDGGAEGGRVLTAIATTATTAASTTAPATTAPAAGLQAERPTRDLSVDLMRAVAMVAVALGHWLVVVPSYADGRFDGVNALAEVPLMRPLTWLFQVMPLFFVVGGVANAASWATTRARGGTYGAWLRTRLARLVRPAALLFVVGAGLAALLRLGGVPADAVEPVAWLVVVPVWFLAVYVLVVAVAPPLWAAHQRWGLTVAVALAGAAGVVDALRLAGVPGVAYVNFLLVFGVAQQVGFAWYDGRLVRPRTTGWALLVGGLGALWLLTHVGPYPVSLVGYPGDGVANNAPPTVTLIALGLAQTGLALVLRPRLLRALERRPVQVAVVALNRNAMTILLWHFTALVLVALVALPWGLVPDHPAGSGAWWLTRVAMAAVCGLVLVPLVALAGRVERAPDVPVAPGQPAGRSLLAAGLLAVAFALVTLGGLNGAGPLVGPLGVPLLAGGLFTAGAVLVSGRK